MAAFVRQLHRLLIAALLAALFVVAQPRTAPAAPLAPGPTHTLAAGDFDNCQNYDAVDDPACTEPDDGSEGEGAGDDCELEETCADGTEGEDVIQWPAPPPGALARLRKGSRRAVAPKSAPRPIRQMIKAANSLVRKPYKWGGGHRKWTDRGYDCSGAVSYVLHAAGYLSAPLTSGSLAKWGTAGAGNWVRIYANKKHVYMVIAGLRFDTTPWGAPGGKGPRWRSTNRPTKGFKLRYPAGL